MKQMLDIIENDIFKRCAPSVTYMRLNGGTDPNKRHASWWAWSDPDWGGYCDICGA
ncbi:hypothetical protein F4604DRAFT_1739234 [Suillus subluteus]|nr:hypothetical protein F4604DRAFT_1739234 [Suillus subluteus]